MHIDEYSSNAQLYQSFFMNTLSLYQGWALQSTVRWAEDGMCAWDEYGPTVLGCN